MSKASPKSLEAADAPTVESESGDLAISVIFVKRCACWVFFDNVNILCVPSNTVHNFTIVRVVNNNGVVYTKNAYILNLDL